MHQFNPNTLRTYDSKLITATKTAINIVNKFFVRKIKLKIEYTKRCRD